VLSFALRALWMKTAKVDEFHDPDIEGIPTLNTPI
jgi:hypothetical protein